MTLLWRKKVCFGFRTLGPLMGNNILTFGGFIVGHSDVSKSLSFGPHSLPLYDIIIARTGVPVALIPWVQTEKHFAWLNIYSIQQNRATLVWKWNIPLKVPPNEKLTLAGILLFNSMTGIMVAPFLVKKYTVGFWFPGLVFHSTCLQCQFQAV